MSSRHEQARSIVRATHPRHRRGFDILGVLSIVVLIGLSVTGVWQFVTHEPDPAWFDYAPGTGFVAETVTASGMAEMHRFFGNAAGIVALLGGGWFIYRIAHRLPLALAIAFGCTVFGALTEALVRFNVVKIEGRSFESVGRGYLQVFTSDVEYVVTDTGELGPVTFAVLVAAHIATVPILVGFGWWSIRRAVDRRMLEIANAPERSWSAFLDQRPEGP